MARGGKRSRPSSAPDDNPRPPRRMSLTPDPDHMDEDFPPPPSSPSASSSGAPNSNSSTSTVNQTNMAQQLPFNPSPSPDPGQQGGAPGGPQHGASGSGAAGPTINVVPPGGQNPSLASNPASGSGSGPLPPPPPPPLAQHQVQQPPVLHAPQPGPQVPFYLNPVPGGGFPAILYRIEHITESMSDPQRQELRNAAVRSAIAFLSEDNPGNDPETRRMVLRAVLDGIGLANVVPRPLGLTPGRTHRRGHAHRRPAGMYLLEDLSPQQELMILQRPSFSTNRGTIFIFSLPLMNHSVIGILGGVVAEVRDASTNYITARVADQLIADKEQQDNMNTELDGAYSPVPQANGIANPRRREGTYRVSNTVDDDSGGLRDPGSNSSRPTENGHARCSGSELATVGTGGHCGAPPSSATAAPPTNNSRNTGTAPHSRKKKSRAALRIGTLNINGASVTSSFHKWSSIQSSLSMSSLSLLALQETHIVDSDVPLIEGHFRKLKVLANPDPSNSSSRNGTAFVLSVDKVRWAEVKHTIIIPGHASLLELPWHGSSTVNILNVYAPSGNSRANTDFWSALLRKWTQNRSLPRVHILLGDFNVVELKYDRLPPKADPAEPIDALDRFKQHFHLVDGWRQVHGPSKPDFTFSMTNSVGRKQWSRLDRIYLQGSLIDQSFFEPPGTPFVGKGRSTAPAFILDFPEAQRLLVKRAIQLDSDAWRVLEQEITDDNKYTIQKVWSSFKRDLLDIATAFARERTSRIDSMLNLWSARQDKILATANESDPDEVEIALTEVEDNIRALTREKLERRKLASSSRFHIEGETNSKYDFLIHKELKPRDTIVSLRTPNSSPPQYEHNFKKMVEIATQYHDQLQDKFHIPVTPGVADETAEDVLSHIRTELNEEQKSLFSQLLTKDDVRKALFEVPNGKAAGLDGLPVEVWKFLVKAYEKKQSDRRTHSAPFDVLTVLTAVLNNIETYGIANDTGFTDGWMCPIYKKKDRTNIANYRPITVLNTDYKVLTRVLSNKLGSVANSLIHEDQAGFLRNRSIFNHTALLHCTVALSELESKNGIIVGLDQEKAYDKIKHDYLWAVLRKFGLPEQFIRTLQSLYDGAETTIILNGVTGSPFRIRRGPLAEMLRSSDLRGLHFPCLSKRLLTCLFADDTTVFLSDSDDLVYLQSLLDTWCIVSGTKFNISKTVIIPVGAPEYREWVRTHRRLKPGGIPIPPDMHIAQKGEPVRILGAYYGDSISIDDVWKPIVEKVRCTLARWDRSRPTIRGRAQAANIMVGGYTQYLVKVQGMSESTLRVLEEAVDDFVYAKKGEKKANAVGIEVLQYPYPDGGLNLLNLRFWNEAAALTNLGEYLKPPRERPFWAYLAEVVHVFALRCGSLR
ncbi:hypothetical protein D9611_010696 [Ephemerocybe angulata]|uniref:Reverse transcriptase domain-containing protein n=1 Tax=Ephemerocybe angulata TaxID=980116 RepID=A0A8H5F1Q6_9AGAR|nr:hypothetical protein D9611_010696 [Tulosesus angulatus]